MLHSVDWNLVTDGSGRPVGPIRTRPANEPPSSQRVSGGRGGWRQQGRSAKSVLQETVSFIGVKPLNVHQSTLPHIQLAAWIPPKKSREWHFLCVFL